MTLAACVTRAEAEHETPAADLVERLDCLGQDRGVVMERRQDPRADLDRRRGGGHSTRHGEAFPPALRWLALWPPEQLVSRPHGVEADPFSADGEVLYLGPANGAAVDEGVAHRQHEADLQSFHRSVSAMRRDARQRSAG